MAKMDEEVNVQQLKLLKRIFEEADEDGSGELDIEEFCDKLGPYLGDVVGYPLKSREDVRQLFMKIDADAGGTVDWDEFTNFMFLQRAEMVGETAAENWRLFPQEFRDRNDTSVSHKGLVDRLLYVDFLDKYVSAGRDGTFRLWNGGDCRHFKTLSINSSWITDCIFMPRTRKLVFTSADRAISYYDANRGSFELTGRISASGSMGVPQCMTLVTNDAGEQLVYGDSKGAVVMLLCGSREWPPRDLISTDEHQDYIYIHQDHTDWVSQIKWVPEIGLVSSSLDSTIKVYDFVRERVINTCTHHVKAVHGFVWCRAYSMFASCGQERDVVLWQGNTLRKVGDLTGHTASVTNIALDERLNHVFTLAADKVIKVWDLRNHKCLQTLTEDDWRRHEESKPNCLYYDAAHRRCLTAVNKPYVWVHKMVAQDRTGHMEPVKAALYNSVFGVVVTADEGGTVCVWNTANGQREGRFTRAHGDARLTSACFDNNERRLLTAAGDGSVRMTNFNNGSLLRQYRHDDEPLEMSVVVYAADEKRNADAVYAAGWNCKVFVWDDADTLSGVVDEYRTFEGHREDISAMVALKERQLLATGDYEGRINVYHLFTGEKRTSLFHRSERYESSVEKLCWLLPPPAPTAHGSHSHSHSAAAMTAAGGSATAAGGWGARGTGGALGGGRTAAGTPESGLGSLNGGAAAGGHAGCPCLLLSFGGDGLMRVWLIGATGKLLATLPAAQGRLDVVSAAAASPEHDHLVVGDTAGHLRVWDLRAGVDVSSMQACRDSFKQRSHWLAHGAGINSVAIMPERGIIVAASKDCNASVWDMDGCLVGILGEHTWDLDARKTWVDPRGEARRPPLAENANLYLASAAGAAGEGGAGEREGEGGRQKGAEASRRNAGGGTEVGGEGAAVLAAAVEGEEEVERDYSAMQRAALKLEEKRVRQREAERSLPLGTHSLLRVHKLQEVPSSARELLGGGDGRSRGGKAGAGRGAGGGGGGGGPQFGSRLTGNK
ncbi:hypothetical protein HYH02_010440 [Chlamydomonas schloesseri]|uniref:EF-hand domain-containing protein n=1 Tax=Chlamydomonas schloesseri TaxID=2026947 RepID=A0A835TLA7_9CHLO|nr:hypothetical protein HYH02_010440 [Chlamydomonas schloesseri]|eukprot:KAG2439805.1 hypothetical protein HYH02_010440 [Chlamydomonas schloesseri]